MATAPFAVFVASTLIILAVFVAVARSSRDSRFALLVVPVGATTVTTLLMFGASKRT